MQAVSKKSFEIFETLSTPKETKGIQDDENRKLNFITEADHQLELARRASDLPKDSNYNFCIVFPTKVAGLGSFTKFQGRFVEIKQKTQIELEDERHAILRAIKEAGFQLQLVYSSTREQILCKIGSNDGRLLKEAENKEHKLELNSKAVKHVLELKVYETFPDAKVSRPKHPVFLDFKNYTEEEFEKIQHLGGPDTLPLYLRKGFDKHDPESSKVDIKTARSTFLAQSRGHPFHHLHFKYDEDWEERIIKEHKVQLYRSYNDGSILRNADRIILTLSALQSNTVTINGVKGAGLNLKKLQFEKQILAYFPIQSVQQAQDSGDLTGDELYERFLWSSSWFPKKIFLAWRQPIQDIRDYCGEKIAYYFAFLEFYSFWLLPSAFFGLLVFGLQLAQLSQQAGTFDIVTQAVQIVNLDLKERFNLADVSNITDEQVADLVFNEPFTSERTPFARSIDGERVIFNVVPTELPLVIPLYALGISIWAAFFLEFWKRHQSALAYRWGVSEYERQAEVRPEFKSEYDVPDAVTGLPTPYRSKFVFSLKLGLSFSVVFSAVLVTVAAFAATYIFKAFMSQSELLNPTVATQVALVLNSVAIMILATVFRSAAATLTSWENHRTDIEYEDHLIGKTFVFSFFNSYTTLIYFAFFRKDSSLPPNEQVQFCVADLSSLDIDFVSNKSAPGLFESDDLVKIDTCYGALGYSLMIIFITQILISNSIEIGTPLITRFMNNYSTGKALRNRAERLRQQGQGLVVMTGISKIKGEDGYHDVAEEKAPDPELNDLTPQGLPLKSLAEHQFLLQPYQTPFDDYLELALQFGYVTLFVAAFPLAPTLALLNNCLEIWVDSKKVCTLSRRPNLPRAQDIGTWLYIFTILSYLAIIINSAVLLFTSVEIVPLDLDREEMRVWAFLAFILSVFFIKYFADFFISDVPSWVTVQIGRQNYIEQKIFYDDEEGTGRLFALREKTGKDGQGQMSSEDLVEKKARDFKEFKPLEQDPYLEEMIQRMKKNLLEKGITEDKLFNMIDVNHNEVITLTELKKLLLRKDIGLGDKMSKAELQIVVDSLDVDDDGKISRDDLRSFLNESHVPTTDMETTL